MEEYGCHCIQLYTVMFYRNLGIIFGILPNSRTPLKNPDHQE
jgi:hypothetical protein